MRNRKEYRINDQPKVYKHSLEWRKKQRLVTKKCEAKIKLEVLTHYSNGKLACVSCAFSDIKALSIDHIKGGGTQHTEGLNRHGGANFYRWLRYNNYPDGYQVLCMNCQFIKRADNSE